jgi:Zn-dependent protease with chaperone function
MPLGGSGGFLLSLVTESFAVRALLGSLAAAGLAAALIGTGVIRSSRARRLLLLAPVLSAAAAAVASIGEVYLPQLSLASGSGTAAGALLEVFGDRGPWSGAAGLDLLVLLYAAVLGVLLTRRGLGRVSLWRTLRPAVSAHPDSLIVKEVRGLAASMGVRTPIVRLLPRCPGGAFTIGTRSPIIAVDPALVDSLDPLEMEGLLAHELAHIARRDTLLGGVVSTFRDLAFFLPPLHIAARWLRREQEESADELASEHTGRPVALASSILKVWDHSRGQRQIRTVCAAVPGRLAMPSGVLVGRPEGAGMKVITARVERLIARVPAPTRLRRWSELAVASAVLVAGTSAAVTVPSWIATELDARSLSFLYLGAPPAAPVESPAFATFRNLTPEEPTTSATAATAMTGPSFSLSPERVDGCPCVETQAQLRGGDAREQRAASNRLAWSSGQPAWQMSDAAPSGSIRTARPLWRLNDTGSQVGFFLVGAPAQ